MGQINSLPSVILPTPKPPGVQPKKDANQQRKEQEQPHQQEQPTNERDDADDSIPHVDAKA